LSTACASARTTGSFVERPTTQAMRAFAVDAARQLALLYPPAHTQLSLRDPLDDEFGRALVNELRGHGFAVAEATMRGSQLTIAYVVDDIAHLNRVLLYVRSTTRRITLARMYAYRDASVRAVGSWTQQVQP
jgi:hypothetical protein